MVYESGTLSPLFNDEEYGSRPTEEGIEKVYPLVWIMSIMNKSSQNCSMSEEVWNRISFSSGCQLAITEVHLKKQTPFSTQEEQDQLPESGCQP